MRAVDRQEIQQTCSGHAVDMECQLLATCSVMIEVQHGLIALTSTYHSRCLHVVEEIAPGQDCSVSMCGAGCCQASSQEGLLAFAYITLRQNHRNVCLCCMYMSHGYLVVSRYVV